MLTANGIQGKYLEYLGKPLVRQGNELYYGDFSEKFYLFILILKEEKDPKFGINIPTDVLIQILPTDNSMRIEKQKQVKSLTEAFEFGVAWLERANRA
ncbi:MAG: hypothetical protein IJY71_05855 [Clostridia bacterium]|nr:hypothetical protein [Clostridia bacterium]